MLMFGGLLFPATEDAPEMRQIMSQLNRNGVAYVRG